MLASRDVLLRRERFSEVPFSRKDAAKPPSDVIKIEASILSKGTQPVYPALLIIEAEPDGKTSTITIRTREEKDWAEMLTERKQRLQDAIAKPEDEQLEQLEQLETKAITESS